MVEELWGETYNTKYFYSFHTGCLRSLKPVIEGDLFAILHCLRLDERETRSIESDTISDMTNLRMVKNETPLLSIFSSTVPAMLPLILKNHL